MPLWGVMRQSYKIFVKPGINIWNVKTGFNKLGVEKEICVLECDVITMDKTISVFMSDVHI